jgi:hypothetical protein
VYSKTGIAFFLQVCQCEADHGTTAVILVQLAQLDGEFKVMTPSIHWTLLSRSGHVINGFKNRLFDQKLSFSTFCFYQRKCVTMQ